MEHNCQRTKKKKRVKSMVEESHRLVDIAKILGTSKSTVSMVLKRFRSRGSTENMPLSGRKKIVGDRELRKLSRVVKLDRHQPLREIAAAYNSSTFETCYITTVQRNLHLLGYKRRSVRKSVNISAANKRKRIYRCRTKLTWTVESNCKMWFSVKKWW